MKAKPNRISILLLASALFMLLGAGCGTVRGIGQDVGYTGDQIEQAAR